MSAQDDDLADALDEPRNDRGGRRALVGAVLFLILVGGGSYACRFVFQGATLVVDADPSAKAVLGTSAVMLRQVDGSLFYTLRSGTQTVRPGRYRIDVDWDKTELTFSTGPEFSVQRGERLAIGVTGRSREP